MPYLEEPETGSTSLFTQELARTIGCYALAGYPERLHPNEVRLGNSVGGNSAIIYDKNGEHVGGYRKTNMFEADLPWVNPGMHHKDSSTLVCTHRFDRHGVCPFS